MATNSGTAPSSGAGTAPSTPSGAPSNNNNSSTNNPSSNNRPNTNSLNSGAVRTGRVVVDAFTKLWNIDKERHFENISADFDIFMSKIDAIVDKMVKGADIVANAYTSSVSVATSAITQGINESAYAAANNKIDQELRSKQFELEQEKIDLLTSNYIKVREQERAGKLSNLDAEEIQAWTTGISELTRIAGHGLNNIDVKVFGTGVNTGNRAGMIADIAADLTQAGVSAYATAVSWENKEHLLHVQQEKQLTEKRLDALQSVEKTWLQAAANVEKAWLSFAQAMEGGLSKHELAANEMGISMGLNGAQLQDYKDSLFATQTSIARWGKTLEDMSRMQGGYQEGTGRNYAMSKDAFSKQIALGEFIGDEGVAQQWVSGAEIFNHSIADSSQMMWEMMNDVNKIGLSGRKFAKDMVQNLKLANKYQFKDGIRGLMQMTKWAQKVGYNMGAVASALEDIQKGGLEGAITKSANMQVLGGRFAMGADPLAMAFEAFNSPQDLAKRYNSMLSGIGRLDSKTGELVVNGGDQMRLSSFAEYSGQSVEDLKAQISRRLKGREIGHRLSGDFNEDERALISNVASKNAKGEWVVTVGRQEKNVGDLTSEDLELIRPAETEESIEKGVWDILSVVKKIEGEKNYMQARLEKDGYHEWVKNEWERIDNVRADFEKEYNTYIGQFKEKMKDATEAQKTYLSIFEKGNSDIDGAITDIRNAGENIAQTLQDVNTKLQESLNKVQGTSMDDVIPKENKNIPDPKNVLGHVGVGAAGYFPPTVPATPMVSEEFVNRRNQEIKKKRHDRAVARGERIAKEVQSSTNTGVSFHLTRDGIVSASGNPMMVSASAVTPINDGIVAKTDPADHGIFAKTGGPFDTLFNDIFGKVNETHAAVAEHFKETDAPMALISEMERLLPMNPHADSEYHEYIERRQEEKTQQSIKVDPIEVRGTFRIESSNKSIDITKMLEEDPMFARALTKMISDAISRNVNGGKSIGTGGNLGNIRFLG